MKSYMVLVGGLKIGSVFSHNIFEATWNAIDLFGKMVEVVESSVVYG